MAPLSGPSVERKIYFVGGNLPRNRTFQGMKKLCVLVVLVKRGSSQKGPDVRITFLNSRDRARTVIRFPVPPCHREFYNCQLHSLYPSFKKSSPFIWDRVAEIDWRFFSGKRGLIDLHNERKIGEGG